MVTIEISYKYRIYPNKKQQETIQNTFNCARFVYNYFLDIRINEYRENKKTVSYNETSRRLTQLKNELAWLKEPDKCALQNSLKDLDTAYQNFFKQHLGFPKFKSKKNNHKSYRTNRTNSTIEYRNRGIKLPKLGWVKTKDRRVPQGTIINATVSQNPDGKYYCSLCCKVSEIEQYHKTGKNVGIDLGLINYATMSDGTIIENPHYGEKAERKLAKLQREMARKSIGGSNWNKVRIKAAKLYKHIANQRKDFLQKLTTEIVQKYDVICIEDLRASEMKMTENSIRNKRVGDASWYEFRRQLTYKSEWYGKTLSVVDRYYPSSQICHICGNNDGKKSLNIRTWTCSCCNTELDRDINAAINILNEGIRIA